MLGLDAALRSCGPDRDCELFPGAGRITREWEPERRPELQSERRNGQPVLDRPVQNVKSSVPGRPRLEEARGRGRPSEEREHWKREEVDFIREHDRCDSDVWFIVDMRWCMAWKAFVKDDEDFPGPIDNTRLVDCMTGLPKPGFFVKEHYRGVNSAVWSFWHRRYGGGPVIQRTKLDLYAIPPEELDKTVAFRRSPRAAAPRAPAVDLDETVVVQRPGRPASLRHDPPSRTGSRQRAASVQPGRSGPSRQEAKRPAERLSDSDSVDSPPGSASRRGRVGTRPVAASSGGGASRRGVSVPAEGGRRDRRGKATKCDRCDGAHDADACPHFSRPRERHKDAWSMLGKAGKAGQPERDVPVVKSARVVPQPGDGSCLFHSLSYGLTGRSQGKSLRREICDFIADNPDLEIGDVALSDWISYDSGGNVQSYAREMSGSHWGGGIEMAAFTKMKGVNVHVYENGSGGYRRISAFESPGAKKTISVLYQGRAHYDALVL